MRPQHGRRHREQNILRRVAACRAVGSARCRPPRSRGPLSRPRRRRATRALRASARVPPGRSPTALRSAVARDPIAARLGARVPRSPRPRVSARRARCWRTRRAGRSTTWSSTRRSTAGAWAARTTSRACTCGTCIAGRNPWSHGRARSARNPRAQSPSATARRCPSTARSSARTTACCSSPWRSGASPPPRDAASVHHRTRARDRRSPPLPFRPDLRKRFHEKRRKAARSGRQEDCSSQPEKIRVRRDTTR